jgi:hypothetical protein
MDASEIIKDVLSHHGVKGQKWGVRRKATVGAQEVVVSDKRKKIKTSGGKGHPAHSDATRARVIGQVGKKSGIKALSDDQLRTYNNRINLEQNTKRLMYEDSSRPAKLVKTILRQTGSKTTDQISTTAAKKVRRSFVTKMAISTAAA